MNLADQIFVLDDVVPDYIYNSTIQEIPNIPMYFGHRGQGYDTGFHFWSNQWDDGSEPWCFKSIWSAFESQKDRLGPVGKIELLRCQLNVTTKSCYGGAHVDVAQGVPYYTMVHFLTGDTGMEFYNGMGGEKIEEVAFKANRCVIFPSDLPHQGLPPIESEPRVSIGYVFGGKGTELTRQNNIGIPIWQQEQEEIFGDNF